MKRNKTKNNEVGAQTVTLDHPPFFLSHYTTTLFLPYGLQLPPPLLTLNCLLFPKKVFFHSLPPLWVSLLSKIFKLLSLSRMLLFFHSLFFASIYSTPNSQPFAPKIANRPLSCIVKLFFIDQGGVLHGVASMGVELAWQGVSCLGTWLVDCDLWSKAGAGNACKERGHNRLRHGSISRVGAALHTQCSQSVVGRTI